MAWGRGGGGMEIISLKKTQKKQEKKEEARNLKTERAEEQSHETWDLISPWKRGHDARKL